MRRHPRAVVLAPIRPPWSTRKPSVKRLLDHLGDRHRRPAHGNGCPRPRADRPRAHAAARRRARSARSAPPRACAGSPTADGAIDQLWTPTIRSRPAAGPASGRRRRRPGRWLRSYGRRAIDGEPETRMDRRILGRDDAALEVVGRGARLHGHVRVLRRRATTPSRSRRSTARSTSASNFLDTADMYGPFTNEELVGRAIAGPPRRGGARDEVRQRARPRTASCLGINGGPSYVHAGAATPRCSGSASTTSTSTTSTASTRTTPIEETVGAMAELVAGGQGALPRAVRGGAGDDPPRARRAPDHRAADRVLAVDAATRRTRSSPTCRELGIGFVAYSPLGRGFLTGPHHDRSTTSPRTTSAAASPRFQGENFEKNLELVERDRGDRRREGLHAGAARARLGAAPRATTSCRSPARSGAATSRRTPARSSVELTADDLQRLDEAAPAGAAAGDRYADMSRRQPLNGPAEEKRTTGLEPATFSLGSRRSTD